MWLLHKMNIRDYDSRMLAIKFVREISHLLTFDSLKQALAAMEDNTLSCDVPDALEAALLGKAVEPSDYFAIRAVYGAARAYMCYRHNRLYDAAYYAEYTGSVAEIALKAACTQDKDATGKMLGQKQCDIIRSMIANPFK